MAYDFCISLFAEPGVVINTKIAVNAMFNRFACGDWWLRRGILWRSANSYGVFLKVLEVHFLY